MALLDELWSGVAVVAAPAIEAEQGMDHCAYALLVFSVPMLLGMLLEPGLAVLSDGWPRRRVLRGSLVALSAALAVCGLAQQAWLLSLGLALAGAASGTACAVAKAELVSVPAAAERGMARWVLLGALGDVLTPMLVAGVLALGGSYRGALLASAAISLLQAARTGRDVDAAPASDDTARLPLSAALRAALHNRALWRWLFGAALCTLLDEIVFAFAILRMERDLRWSPEVAAACATAISLGSVLGAWVTERSLARMSSTRVLHVSAWLAMAALALVVAAHSLAAMLPGLLLVGFAAAPQYALIEARAYAALPERPGVVHAAAQVFTVLELAAPLAVGWIADHFGLGVALAVLTAQPLTVLGLLALAGRAERRAGS
jgi:MFS transporter, FSR family, fosmidomycin resistance protein